MDNWSFKLCRLWGIDVRIHITFIGLLIWTWFVSGFNLLSVMLTVCIFAAVLLHEYGHALTARRFGVSTKDITLWMCGGVASLQGMPKKPKEEMLTALAGPAVNLVLAALFYAVHYFVLLRMSLGLTALLTPEDVRIYYILSGFPYWFAFSNLFLALFNLVPAFPMDGGRVLRGLLEFKFNKSLLQATEICVKLGRICAVVMIFASFFYNNMLLFIALFIWLNGSRELKAVKQADLMQRIQTGKASPEEILKSQIGNLGGMFFDMLKNAGTEKIMNAFGGAAEAERMRYGSSDIIMDADYKSKASVKAEDADQIEIIDVK